MTLLDKLVTLLPKADERLIRKQTQIAGQIYHLLSRKNWKQRDLAELAGLKESYVSRVLAGDVNLTLESIAKMEAAFDEDVIAVPLYYFPETEIDFSGIEVMEPVLLIANQGGHTLWGSMGYSMAVENVTPQPVIQQPKPQEYSYAQAA